jgi:hypothetical protein
MSEQTPEAMTPATITATKVLMGYIAPDETACIERVSLRLAATLFVTQSAKPLGPEARETLGAYLDHLATEPRATRGEGRG